MRMRTVANREGFALLMVLLLTMVVGALGLSAITLFSNSTLINIHAEKQAEMEAAALSGTELGRMLINRRPALYPDSGYNELPLDSLELIDALGNPITGVTQTVYAGPTGVATGQFGVFGSVVSIVEDPTGNRAIFRREMVQESFAKFAYFTDTETQPNGDPIFFAPGDQLFGPVHSNDAIRIMNAAGGPVFHGPVASAMTITNAHRAQFRQGYEQRVGRIELPPVSELSKLLALAQQGSTDITSTTFGAAGEATTRIEFVAIDIDGDGVVTADNEGFYKVYRAAAANAAGARWVVAGRTNPAEASPNCGRRAAGGMNRFYTAAEYDALPGNNAFSALQSNTASRCYLGGSDSLSFKGAHPDSVRAAFLAQETTARGRWVAWGGTWGSSMPAAIANRADRDYLVPMGREYNPNFKGVIHVTGHVAISGTVRGRVTLATTGNIVIADDVRYSTDPAAATCNDILGLFAGGNIVVADNALNAPMSVDGVFRTYDSTRDEVVHGVLLTLGSFTVQNFASGSDDDEDCGGAQAGRGCLFVTGGIIQSRRGAVGQQSGGGITGYLKRYSYDQCAATAPPPYYPTTGYFTRGRIFEVNPVGFDIADYFDRITAG